MALLGPIFGLIVLVALLAYFLYIRIIHKRNKVQEAFSGIDVQLKKRHDLIPNILTIAKKFMEHERGLMEEITKLRTEVMKDVDPKDAGAVQEQFNTEGLLQGKMGQLMVAVENYPNLKSDASMLQAQQTYNEVEEHIAAARRFYNAAALELKNLIQIFPVNLLANMVKVEVYPFFEAEEGERASVNAADIL